MGTDGMFQPRVTINVYGLTTDQKIRAIKMLRSIGYAVGDQFGTSLKACKDAVDALSRNDGATMNVRVPEQMEALVRDGLKATGFALDRPNTYNVLSIG